MIPTSAMSLVIQNSLTGLKLLLDNDAKQIFEHVGCRWRADSKGVLFAGYEMKKCLIEIWKLLELIKFDHPEAVKAFIDATVVDVMQKPNTETDTPALRIETFLRQYIEGTTTGDVDTATDVVVSAKPFDCFVEELMNIYHKAADSDAARKTAIAEMALKTLRLVQRLGKEAAATVKPKIS